MIVSVFGKGIKLTIEVNDALDEKIVRLAQKIAKRREVLK